MAFVAGDFSAGTAYKSATQTWSMPMPSDVAAGDWLYLVLCCNTDSDVSQINGNAASATPTTIGVTAGGWECVEKSVNASTGFHIWEKQHSGSEANPCVVFWLGGAEVGVGIVFRVRHAAASVPRGGLTRGTSGTTTGSITPPVNDSAILAVVYIDPAAAVTWTWADATEIFDESDAANASVAAAYFIQTTAAAKALAYTPSPANTVGWTAWEMEPGADTSPSQRFMWTP